MLNNFLKSIKSDAHFLVGLIIFTGLNIFSASTMELHFDEAYYWLYSQHPALGYFDHPPMISWLIFVGQYLFAGELGIRIMSIMLSTISMIFLWRLIKSYHDDAILFWSLIYAVILIHPYSFIATPDSPLFCFSILFFFIYKKYLERCNFQNLVLLALIIALMLYSKYHALLIVFFVIISNLLLFKKNSFWGTFILALIYFLPHIFWQIDNGFPTLQYHLIDSHKTAYTASVTFDYILSELAVTGPLLGWLFLYALISIKSDNTWERGLKYTGVGTFIFFLISTSGGDFEAHWTLIAITPLLIFSYKFILKKPSWQKWVKIAGLINFVMLLFIRIIIITPLADNIEVLKLFKGNKKEAAIIKKKTGNASLLFQDSWTKASLYAYYTNNKFIGNLNSSLHRKNQFDFYDLDERVQGDSVYVLSLDSLQFKEYQQIKTNKSTWYAKKIGNFHSYYNLSFDMPEIQIDSDTLNFKTTIHNPYEYMVFSGSENNPDCKWQLYTRCGRKWVLLSEYYITNLQIPAESDFNAEGSFILSNEIKQRKRIYLTLKIGDLKPIPTKWEIKLKQ